MVLGYVYNDLYLADWGWIIWNVLNALGFCSFASAVMEVVLGTSLSWKHRVILQWLGIIVAVVSTTFQAQDTAK